MFNSTLAPATRSSGSVCSAGLWLMPFTLGTNTMPAGHTSASIWASWPAPDGILRTDSPSAEAVDSTSSTTRESKTTGSKRATHLVSISTPSDSAIRLTSASRRRSAD